MKILLIAINAKYIHSNLAVYCLKSYAAKRGIEVELTEYTINHRRDDILMDIYQRKPDVVAFSCYIWNLEFVRDIAADLYKVLPDLEIWGGGPEVSYDAKEVLRRLPCVKGVMKGEGEKTFKEICRIYRNEFEKRENVCGYQDKNVDNSWKKSESVDNQLKGVDGITFREEKEKIIDNPWRPIMDLSEVPFVYDHMEDFEHKIIYYETSRGCPFSCSYCLSSVDKRLRFRNIELVKKELQFFLDHKVPQVKFVDRTFNCKHDHSIAIWKYIMEHDNGITNFHFEIAADILNEEEMELLEQMRPGLVQLEIGVQSTNPKTIKEIHRVMDFEKVSKIVRRIQDKGNVHEHLDLIAGLPGEDAADMQDTLEKIEKLHPDSLTVHALAIKRAAKFGQEGRTMDPGTEITQMVEAAAASAERMGLVPYYLYRQKNIAGNFENVGYAEKDKAGVYNILIMEERQTIIACGAGSTTKLVLPEKIKTSSGKETNLIRVENVKNITEYIDRIDEMIERKEALFEKD